MALNFIWISRTIEKLKEKNPFSLGDVKMIVGSKEYMVAKYGEEQIQQWIEDVEPKQLWKCMEAFSNESFVDWNIKHRDKHLNALEMVLQETPNGLYPTVTYGVAPNTVCTCMIGNMTGRIYGNLEIATFLIQENISELKSWLLENYSFSEDEKRLLHYDFGDD